MITLNIEQKFLDFFSQKGFKQIDGNNIISKDPELLFNIAGMTNIKEYFYNPQLAPFPKLCSSQKCIRINDLDEIGDETHLTLFHMLGIFVFNDAQPLQYIDLIWEFICSIFNKKDLLIKIHESDIDVIKKWEELNPQKIVLVSGMENMWFSGDIGPCGLGSEIFFVGDNESEVEIVNIVTINGTKTKETIIKRENILIDVGIGLERMYHIQENVDSVFSTSYLLNEEEKIFNSLNIDKNIYHLKERRVLFDHLRTAHEMVKNNIISGVKKREYILRRLLRRVLAILKDNFKVLNINNEYTALYEQLLKEKLLIVQNEKQIRKFLQNKTFINGQEIFFLKDTLGCNIEELRKTGYNNINFNWEEYDDLLQNR